MKPALIRSPHPLRRRTRSRPIPHPRKGKRAAGKRLARRAARLANEMRSPLFVPELYIRWCMRRAGLQPSEMDLPNGQMHAWIGKPGKPALLLLHGFGSDAAWQWHPQVVALSEHYRLFVPDLLYFGKSRGRHEDYSLEYQLEACMQLMDRYGHRTFDVVGISFGGLIAYELAAHEHERVSRLVVSNSSGPVYGHDDHQSALDHFDVDHLNDLLLPENAEDVRRLLHVAWHRPPFAPRFALREAHRRMFMDFRHEKAETMRGLVDRIETPELLERTIRHETLLLWGEHDRIFSVDVAKRLREQIGERARLHVIADAAHSPNQEHAGEYNRVLVNFLQGRPLSLD